MKPLDLHSERYAPTGNLASEGVRNQLGRPTLDPLTVLLRESVQNSWDARIRDGRVVEFGIDAVTLDPRRLQGLREVVFARIPPKLPLGAWLEAASPRLAFVLWDRGTVGLGGPTRADVAGSEGEEAHDFVDFLRNVGSPPDKPQGGGTFGYGKAALYRVSETRTILIHTRCRDRGREESRFIAAALGDRFDEIEGTRAARFTGRHWWGSLREGLAEPLRDAEADEVAALLGMPVRPIGDTGSSIMVLGPRLGERTAQQAMNVLVLGALWHLWPKLVPASSGATPMRITLRLDGAAVPIPDPRSHPPLDLFAGALEHARRVQRGEPRRSVLGQVIDVRCERPQRHLGLLALRRGEHRSMRPVSVGEPIQLPVEGGCHHIALLRAPELVVRYLAGPPMGGEGLAYAGVFQADAALDTVFAASEPPTHDDWTPDDLPESRDRTFVRVALRRIQEGAKSFVAPAPVSQGTGSPAPLGRFSGFLGGLLAGVEGTGAGVQPYGPPIGRAGASEGGERAVQGRPSQPPGTESGSGESPGTDVDPVGRARTGIELLGEPELEVIDGQRAQRLRFRVRHASGATETTVRLELGVVLEGDALEVEPPAGATLPSVLRWIDPSGRCHPGTAERLVAADDEGAWAVEVSIPDDVLVDIGLRARRGSA